MKTIIVGASPNPDRYAYHAAMLLKQYGHEFVPLSVKSGVVFENPIMDIRTKPVLSDVHTITLYMRAELQQDYLVYLLSLKPKRIIFNPGTENPAFAELAEAEGIETLEACTLVMLRTGQY